MEKKDHRKKYAWQFFLMMIGMGLLAFGIAFSHADTLNDYIFCSICAALWLGWWLYRLITGLRKIKPLTSAPLEE